MPQIDLAPHQRDAVEKLGNGKILWGGTGSGKSRVAVAYYMNREKPRPIFVITTAKKRDELDWQKEFASVAVGMRKGETIAGVLTIDSWNNIGRYADVEGAFFIFDEQRVVGSGVWVEAFLKIAESNHWILLTATPGDTWLDYVPVFIANGYYKNRAEFNREHVTWKPFRKFPQVDHFNGVGSLLRLRNELLVEMPYLKDNVRHSSILGASYDRDLYKKILKERWNIFKDRPLKNSAELFYTLRKLCYSDPSRMQLVRSTLEHHPKLIIFYNFAYEVEILRGLSDIVEVSEWNGQRHQDIPRGNSWAYLVQYTAGSEGWNCITTNATFFHSQTYSYKMWDQAHGRIDRMNSPYPDMYYYTAMADSPIERAVAKALKEKRSFNEKRYEDSDLYRQSR